MFRTLSLAASLVAPAAAQIGGPPIPPPGPPGTHLSAFNFTLDRPGFTELLTVEAGGPDGKRFLVYNVDSTGLVSLDDVIDADELTPRGFGPDRIAATEDYVAGAVQLFERHAGGWVPGPRILGQPFAAYPYGVAAAFDGSTLALGDPGGAEIDLFDVSVQGSAVPTDAIAIPGPRFATAIRLEGTTLVATVRDRSNGIANLSVLVFDRGAAGWSLAQEVQPPQGIAWDTSRLVIDLDGDRLVIGQEDGVAGDPAGRVYVYERVGGTFQFDAELRGVGRGALSSSWGTKFGSSVVLGGDEIVVGSRYHARGERFARTAAGWNVVATYLPECSVATWFGFAGPLVVGTSFIGVQVYDATSSRGRIDVVCATPAAGATNLEWTIQPGYRESTGVRTLYPEAFVLEPFLAPQPMVLLVAAERGNRVLGPESELCLGGRIRRFVAQSSFFPPLQISGYQTTFDPALYGFGAGDTVFFQYWRSEPGLVGGITSSAVAVTFAP